MRVRLGPVALAEANLMAVANRGSGSRPLHRGDRRDGKKILGGIRKGLREKAREEHSLLQSVEATAANGISEMVREVRKLAKNPNAEGAEKLGPVLSVGVDLFRNTVVPLLEEVRQLPNAEEAFDKNYLPEIGPVGIHREFITAAARWIMAAKL